MNTANQVTAFNFSIAGHHDEMLTHSIRVVTTDDQPWFLAVDVCKALGMDTSKGTHKWLKALSSDEKKQITPGLIVGKGMGLAVLISESGLYKLIMRSDKPQAKAFQDWVTKTVLPAIRKDGAYVVGEEKVASGELSEDEFLMKAWTILQKKVERLSTENAIMAPKAEVFDAIMEERNPTLAKFTRSLTGVNTIAAKRDLLRLGYLYKAKGVYRVYAKHRGSLFSEKMNPAYGSYDIFVLPEGAKELTKLFKAKKLTMLKK